MDSPLHIFIQIVAGGGILALLVKCCISKYKTQNDLEALTARFKKLSADFQKERNNNQETINRLKEYYEGEINRYKNEWKIAHDAVERSYACGYVPK